MWNGRESWKGSYATLPDACAIGISEGFYFKLALDWVPDTHCTTKAAALCCLSGLVSSEGSVCPLGTLNQSVWGQAGDSLQKCTPDPNQNAHAGTSTRTGMQRVRAWLGTWRTQPVCFPALLWKLLHLQTSALNQSLWYLQHFPSQTLFGKCLLLFSATSE